MKKHVMCTWLVGRGGDLVSAVYKNCNDKKININMQNKFIITGKMAHECRPGIIRKTSIEPYTSLRTQFLMNPLTPVSDQDRIFSYNMNTLSSRQAMRIKKNIY